MCRINELGKSAAQRPSRESGFSVLYEPDDPNRLGLSPVHRGGPISVHLGAIEEDDSAIALMEIHNHPQVIGERTTFFSEPDLMGWGIRGVVFVTQGYLCLLLTQLPESAHDNFHSFYDNAWGHFKSFGLPLDVDIRRLSQLFAIAGIEALTTAGARAVAIEYKFPNKGLRAFISSNSIDDYPIFYPEKQSLHQFNLGQRHYKEIIARIQRSEESDKLDVSGDYPASSNEIVSLRPLAVLDDINKNVVVTLLRMKIREKSSGTHFSLDEANALLDQLISKELLPKDCCDDMTKAWATQKIINTIVRVDELAIEHSINILAINRFIRSGQLTPDFIVSYNGNKQLLFFARPALTQILQTLLATASPSSL